MSTLKTTLIHVRKRYQDSNSLKKIQGNSTFLYTCILIALFGSCKPSDKTESAAAEAVSEVIEYNNPPGEDFNAVGSDPVAVLLADQVMNAMGGREAWDKTDIFYWNFFGFRTLLWDKENDRVRINIPGSEITIAMDMGDMSGTVWQSGEQLNNQDSIDKYLQRGKEIWINDAYWLFMPFKLKDSGVTLTYAREDTTLAGENADVLRLTFENVGVTPENAYEVWVDVEDRLVKQWAYFREADQDSANFILPWTEYKDYNGLLLSGERGDRDITEIKVLEKLPEGAFEKPGKLEI